MLISKLEHLNLPFHTVEAIEETDKMSLIETILRSCGHLSQGNFYSLPEIIYSGANRTLKATQYRGSKYHETYFLPYQMFSTVKRCIHTKFG